MVQQELTNHVVVTVETQFLEISQHMAVVEVLVDIHQTEHRQVTAQVVEADQAVEVAVQQVTAVLQVKQFMTKVMKVLHQELLGIQAVAAGPAA